MKFLTFNIRYDTPHDGSNDFNGRRDLIIRTLEKEQPDVICFQELLAHNQLWMKEQLKGYYLVGCGRDPKMDGERVSIAFRWDKFDLLAMETYWLSETPYVAATRYAQQSDCPRVCCEVVLKELATGKVFRVVSVHLDHLGALARELGLKQILKHLDEAQFCPDAPVVLAGDFNAEPDDTCMQTLYSCPEWVNATEGVGITYHGYFQNPEAACSIDYIWLKGDWKYGEAKKWEHREGDIFLSDHYPVCIELDGQ